MKVACISFTNRGSEIGKSLVERRDSNLDVIVHHFQSSKVEGGIKNKLKDIVVEYDGIVFISATGIAVRMMCPYIINKVVDPAVVVVDDLGRYSISLLSGHIGGGNELCKWVANILGAEAIITTASDGRGIESIDMFAMRMAYQMENMQTVKRLTTMMVNGESIGLYSEMKDKIKYDNIVYISDLEEVNSKEVSGIICVTSNKNVGVELPYTVLRPKNLNIGVGCKKGVSGKRIIEAIISTLKDNNLSEKSIKSINTIDIKKDELGIIEASRYFKCPINIYTVDEIIKVEDMFEGSSFVKKAVGVSSVSGPCAYLAGGKIVVEKTKCNGITIAVSKEV